MTQLPRLQGAWFGQVCNLDISTSICRTVTSVEASLWVGAGDIGETTSFEHAVPSVGVSSR